MCAHADRLGLLPDVVVRTVDSPARADVNSATDQRSMSVQRALPDRQKKLCLNQQIRTCLQACVPDPREEQEGDQVPESHASHELARPEDAVCILQ